VTPESDLIFIIGRQRSGTTVLRKLLHQHGAVDCGEIFHGDFTREGNFYAYLLERIETEPSLVHPHRHAQVFAEYVEKLRADANGAKIAMDVKYFALHLIPLPKIGIDTIPFILRFIRRQQASVLHLIRRNKLRVLVSAKLSRETDHWEQERQDGPFENKPKISIHPKQAIRKIANMQEKDEMVEKLLANMPNCSRIYYENMFSPDGNFSEETLKIVKPIMGLDATSNVPEHIRMNPEPLEMLVENYADIRRELMNSSYRWMLEEDGAGT